ncbi:speckle-type POZ protein B-like [Trichogramma pretiosum]|uniref:speckle-type POZ protein B-like n=1 Tax=Trichogramma pretiosum TaxID=7493 RepID=UPI0006C95AD6|nr:speckle-type POZ protein B-like [Trichogramma pretiosum]
MSANEVECYTQINKEKCVFTWVISDWLPFWNKCDAQISSSVFNVGSDNSFQFQLQFFERTDEYGKQYAGLDIRCLKSSTELLCEYNISVIKDDQLFSTYEGYITHNDSSFTIFENNVGYTKEFISSTGSVTFCCKLFVFTGDHHTSLNKECVDNNEASKSRLSKFDSMFLNEKFSDVKIRTACGKEIPAHRVVLATASPVFSAMFDHDMLENKHQLVDMVDVTYEAAVEMLRYVYTDVIENLEVSITIDLLVAADKYQLEDMKNKCELILSSKVSPENAIDILQVADKYSMKNLKKKAVDFIRHNISDSSDSDELGTLILSMGKFFSK